MLSQFAANGRKQAGFPDRAAEVHVPAINAERHDGQVRQIDERPRSIGPQELAGSHFAYGSAHTSSPASVAGGRGIQGGSPPVKRVVFMTSRTPGSTSRIDIGTVKSSQG